MQSSPSNNLQKERQNITKIYIWLLLTKRKLLFDRVDRAKLWITLQTYGVPQHLISLCQSIYANSQCAVRTSTGTSDNFHIHSGVRQGCVLSPLLFITYIDHICKVAKTTEENNLKDNLNELLFADDQALVASSEEELQRQIDRLHQTCHTFNMKINIEKTK